MPYLKVKDDKGYIVYKNIKDLHTNLLECYELNKKYRLLYKGYIDIEYIMYDKINNYNNCDNKITITKKDLMNFSSIYSNTFYNILQTNTNLDKLLITFNNHVPNINNKNKRCFPKRMVYVYGIESINDFYSRFRKLRSRENAKAEKQYYAQKNKNTKLK